MPEINELRLFESLRLHPWKEHDRMIIDGEIARLTVHNPQLATEFRAKYDAKLAAWEAVHAPVTPEETPKEVDAPVELPKEPKKRKSKKA